MEIVIAFLRPIVRRLLQILALASCVVFMGLTKDTVFFKGTSFATNGNDLGFAILALLVVIFFTSGRKIPNPISTNDNQPIENSKKPPG